MNKQMHLTKDLQRLLSALPTGTAESPPIQIQVHADRVILRLNGWPTTCRRGSSGGSASCVVSGWRHK